MSRRLVTAPRQVRFAGRVLVAAAIAVAAALVSVGAALRGDSPDAAGPGGGGPEPVLDAGAVTRSKQARREGDSPPARRRAPVVVQALAPGQAPSAAGRSEAEPPQHIREENVRLRRALEDLRALEDERRRVARALAAAGVPGDGLLPGTGRLIWPVGGPLTSPFGQRWGRLHAGIDVSASSGTPIRAADSGRVVLAGWQGGYGLYTCVKHNSSLSTCYAHQSRLGTRQGAAVRKGQVIGYVGNTGHSFGTHLHFETWVRGRPVDPMGFL